MDQINVIDKDQLLEFSRIFNEYRSGKANTEQRIISSENWWKLRNGREERKETQIGKDGGFTSVSGWLHNVIVSKHADAMASYPEPLILPREQNDRAEAHMLSSVLPCILEQNKFERTYSDVMWQKLKTGTGVYKIAWDSSKLNGLGDISIEKASLLNIFWEPGITDIQKSRYFFHTELYHKEELEAQYPELKDRLKGNPIVTARFQTDDTSRTDDKYALIDVYYKRKVNGRTVVHLCKYVNDIVLAATENDPATADTGLYSHGMYPYVFDTLYPIEGSPCGYGYVDVCRNPQTEIDLIKTAMVKNAMVGATPRYFRRIDGGVNVKQFLDLSNPLVDVDGDLGEDTLRRIDTNNLDGNYIAVLDRTIQELRETSGNTETSTGNIQSGVTAASAIAALQEASGKGSRDSTQTSYRAFTEIIEQCIELIRQFYDMPRQFRITGAYGMEQYVSYSNAGLIPQHQGVAFGEDMGYRLPVFDVKVSAQKKDAYTKMSQNELALQLFKMGMFNPNMVDQALVTMEMMDFEGKDELMQKLARNGAMFQKLIQYMQLSLALTAKYEPRNAPIIQNDVMKAMQMGTPSGTANTQLVQSDNIAGIKNEPANVKNAKERSINSSQPDSGRVIKERK